MLYQKGDALSKDQGNNRDKKGHVPFGQIILDDMFLLLMLGITVPFIIYLAWGYIDLASLPAMPDPEFSVSSTGQIPTNSQIDTAQLINAQGCLGCHSTDGSQRVGPTWLGLFGTSQSLTNGSEVTVDEAYLKRAILDPDADIAEGQSSGLMPSYSNQLSEAEVEAIVTYIKELE